MQVTLRFKPDTALFATDNELALFGEIEIRDKNGQVLYRQQVRRSVFEEVKRVMAWGSRPGPEPENGQPLMLPKMTPPAREVLEGLMRARKRN